MENSGKKYIHTKTGKPYSVVTEHAMFKLDGVWVKDLVIYQTEYENPDGKYFIRTKEDFDAHFVEVK